MRGKVAVLALIIMLLAALTVGCAQQQTRATLPAEPAFDAATIYEKAAPATWTVLVNTVDGWWAKGSGFSVNAPGTVLTAYHVVKDYKEFKLVDWDGDTTYKATLKRFDEKLDVALLEVENPSNTAYLALAGAEPKVGENVALISSPMTNEGKANGYIASALTVGRVAKRLAGELVVDVEAMHGSSGGAILDREGRVVGLLRGAASETSRLHGAVPRTSLAAFLSSH